MPKGKKAGNSQKETVPEADLTTNPSQDVINVLISIVVEEMRPPARQRLLGRALDGVGNAVRMENCRVFGIPYGVAAATDDLLSFVFEDEALVEGRLAILFANPAIRDRMASSLTGHQKLDAALLREREASK